MKITDLHVSGFGVWSDLRLNDLDDRLTVFYGANEAGKTTLMQFVRSMLYGLSADRQRRYYPPVHGGTPGGQLTLASHLGRLTIERYWPARGTREDLIARGRVTVRDDTGSDRSATVLDALLSGVDEPTYNNVFSVGLRELQELGTLDDTDAADLLYQLTTGRFIRQNDRWFQQIMRYRKRTFIFLAAALLLIVACTVTFNSAGFLPPIDEGAVLIEYVMRPGVSLRESYRMGERLTGEILQLPDIDNVYLKIGSPENTYYIEGANRGELRIKLKDKQRRQRSAKEVMELLRRKFSALEGVVFLFHQPTEEKIDESFSGLPAFFGISISGDNLDTLVALSQKVEDVASNNTGLTNIINTAKYTVPQIEVVPNRPVLGHYGLSVAQVLQQMSVAFRGDIISYFVKEQTPIAIFLRLPERQRKSIENLRALPIKTASGAYIPLQEVATIGYRNTPAEITHVNSQREVTLMGEIAGNPYTIVKKLQAKLRAVRFPAGYFYEIRGQYQTLMQSLKEMALVIVAAILLVYLVLYLQFNSFWQPFVILLKIPLDFMGAFLALLLTKQSLNIAVAIGLLTLVGVAVNNAIVLIDMVNQLRASRNLSPQEALLEALHIRTRPILMTSLTTIFALLPAAIGMGVGSKIHQPFAITLIGGLLVGTFFTLNIIPALYEKIGRWAKVF